MGEHDNGDGMPMHGAHRDESEKIAAEQKHLRTPSIQGIMPRSASSGMTNGSTMNGHSTDGGSTKAGATDAGSADGSGDSAVNTSLGDGAPHAGKISSRNGMRRSPLATIPAARKAFQNPQDPEPVARGDEKNITDPEKQPATVSNDPAPRREEPLPDSGLPPVPVKITPKRMKSTDRGTGEHVTTSAMKRKTASKRRNDRIISGALLLVALLCLGLGICFLVKPKLVHKNQENAEKQLLEQIKIQMSRQAGNHEPGGDTDPSSGRPVSTGNNTHAPGIPLKAEITIPAGEVELPDSFDDGVDVILPPGETIDPNKPRPTQEKLDKNKIVRIQTDGIMLIPCIELEVGIGTNVSRTTLAIVPGHLPGTPQPGEIGVASYFGHKWIYKPTRHFSRLCEVPVGETIEIQRAGKRYTYRIDMKETITPDRIGTYVYQKTDQSRILLVTCYRPDGNSSGAAPYRTVVGAYLVSTKPLS